MTINGTADNSVSCCTTALPRNQPKFTIKFPVFLCPAILTMATSERTPLLNGTASESPTPPINERLVSFFTAEGGPSWSDSFRSFFFGSYLNTLLVFVPLSYVSHILNWDAALRFSFSFLAIIPLAQVCLFGSRVALLSRCASYRISYIHFRGVASWRVHGTDVNPAGPNSCWSTQCFFW